MNCKAFASSLALAVGLGWCAFAGAAADESAAAEVWTRLPEAGQGEPRQAAAAAPRRPASAPDRDLHPGFPVDLGPPGAGFPYTPTLFDVDHDGAAEIFLTGGETFGLEGDGSFIPGWPVAEHAYMGYGTNAQKPGPSCADLEGDGDVEVLWSERDWWAGSAHMWCFNGREAGGANMPDFPSFAPDDYSNALDVPFVLGDGDGDGTLEAWGPHTLGNNFVHYRITAFGADGELLFTRDLDPAANILALHFGDLDGDGGEEFFALAWQAPELRLFAFTALGGDASGFPVTLASFSGGFLPFGPPVPFDLDGDGDLELVAGYNESGQISRAHAFHHDGSAVAGFPRALATSSQLFYLGLGDLTGDGRPELLALDNDYAADYRAFAFDLASGEPLSGWPVAIAGWPNGFPCVADVDGDGRQDVVLACGDGQLVALEAGGAPVAGYPKTMASGSISGAAAGDIDGDGLFELVAATWDGLVYAWDTAGPALPGRADWPLRGVDARNTGVFVASDPAATPTPTPTSAASATPPPPTATATPTPEASATATPAPTVPPLGVRLEVPALAHPGAEFHVTGFLDNPGEALAAVPVFFILEVSGEYWFWDEWEGLDYALLDVSAGITTIEVIPAFVWPDTGSDEAAGLRFWGAMLNPAMTEVLGGHAVATWGYGPE